MSKKNLFQFVIFFTISYVLHYLALTFLNVDVTKFYYSVAVIYLFFVLFSLAIVWATVKINDFYETYVGMVFIAAISLKMVFGYLVLRPVLALQTSASVLEKKNILIVLLASVAIDVFFAVKTINKKKS